MSVIIDIYLKSEIKLISLCKKLPETYKMPDRPYDRHYVTMDSREKVASFIFFLARCHYCNIPCVIKCGHCCTALMFLGQKHDCPDPDEGFFDDNDFDIQLCGRCDQESECLNNFPKIQPHKITL